MFKHELAKLWPGHVLVDGRPRHPESQGSVKKNNGTLKNSLISWMRNNKTSNWTARLPFTQWGMNTTFSKATKVVPYEALFGMGHRIGLWTNLTVEFLEKIPMGLYEEKFEELFGENLPSTLINER